MFETVRALTVAQTSGKNERPRGLADLWTVTELLATTNVAEQAPGPTG